MQIGAFDKLTNIYTLPFNAVKGKEYYCVDCNEKVILRKGKIRKHHFAHLNTSNCMYFDHPNESQQHKDAKLKLAERLKQKFELKISNHCHECSAYPTTFDDVDYICDKDDIVVLEYRDSKGKYIADIAVLSNNKVKTIFEIKHTHETTTNVRPEPWYEITTEEIFEEEERLLKNESGDSLDKDKMYLSCVRKSQNRLCINCKIKTESWARNIPSLQKRVGIDGCWKQIAPCIICKREQYNPQYICGSKQLCKICCADSYDKLKEMFDKPLFFLEEE